MAPHEQVLKEMAAMAGENYNDLVVGLQTRRVVPQATILKSVDYLKNGKIKAAIVKDLKKARRALAKNNLKEIARTLESICVADSAYHRLRTVCDLEDELPALYSVKKNRIELNQMLKEKLCFQELLGGGWIVQYSMRERGTWWFRCWLKGCFLNHNSLMTTFKACSHSMGVQSGGGSRLTLD